MFALLSQPMQRAQSLPTGTLDIIFIEGFTAPTVIGIHESELHVPQPVTVDVAAGLARSPACSTDRIQDTVDYAMLRERLHRLFVAHKLQLLEAFAEEIARITTCEFGAAWVRVTVRKPRKFDDVMAVGVSIERAAEDVRTSHTAHALQPLKMVGQKLIPGQ